MSKEKAPFGRVVVVNKDGQRVHGEWVEADRPVSWAALLDNWPHDIEGEDIVVRLPLEAAVFKKPKPLTCLISAIDSYMNSILGRKLDNSDRDWFDDHALTGKGGVSQPNTLRVAQELIEPYGLRISRVRVAPGVMLTGDLLQWPKVLGINPLAMANQQTSNADFCQQMGLPLEDAERMFRFEFAEGSIRPAILCGEYGYNDKGTRVVMGHASYEGPRAKLVAQGLLQFQIQPAEKMNWEQDPVFAPVMDEESNRELDLFASRGKDGEAMWKHNNRRSLPPSQTSTQAGETQTTTMVHQPLGPVGLVSSGKKGQIRDCFLCASTTADRVGANLCIRCWAIFCGFIKCEECGNPMTGPTMTSAFRRMWRRGPDWWIGIECCWCAEETEVLCVVGSDADDIAKCIRAEDPFEPRGNNGGSTSTNSKVRVKGRS